MPFYGPPWTENLLAILLSTDVGLYFFIILIFLLQRSKLCNKGLSLWSLEGCKSQSAGPVKEGWAPF